MAYLMGIDLGTSNLKVIIADYEGNVKALSTAQYKFDTPFNGYAEQDPEVWWRACRKCIHSALSESRINAHEIKGISFSGQMHGLIVFDKDKKIIRPAILHCDTRSFRQVRYIKELFGEKAIKKLIRNPVYTGFLLPSLLWVRDNEAENYKKIRYVCLPKDYLRYKLTGSIDSDFSDASATLAFDLENCCWSKDILNKLNIPYAIFPPCRDTVAVTGNVTGKASAETGLEAGTPVICGGGDQIMQGIGNGATSAKVCTVNIGTSGQVCFQSDKPILNPKMNTNLFCGYKKGRWIVLGATMNAGLSLRFFKNLLKGTSYGDIDKNIEKIKPGSGGLIYLPYLNGERAPYFNPNLSGMLMGLNMKSDVYTIDRAVMEGVSYSLMQCIEICGGLGLKPQYLVASGGGAKSMPWLHILSDVFNYPIRVNTIVEQAGMGAVIAAGVGAGVYKDIDEGCKTVVKYKDGMIIPDTENHKIYQDYYQLYKDTYSACGNVLEQVTLLGKNIKI